MGKLAEAVKKCFRPKRQTEENNGQSMVAATGLHLSQEDRIRRIIRMEMFRNQVNNEAETFEEADDFDLPDGDEWHSPYEETFEPVAPDTPPPVTPATVSPKAETTPPPATDPPPAPPAA